MRLISEISQPEEIEWLCIGCAIELPKEVLPKLRLEHFGHSSCRNIFIRLDRWFKRNGDVEEQAFFNSFWPDDRFLAGECISRIHYVPTPYNWPDWVSTLIENSIERWADLAKKQAQKCREEGVQFDIDAWHAKMQELRTIKTGEKTARQAMRQYVENFEAYVMGQPGAGLATGYARFDAITGGLVPKYMIVISGRPAMGKSSWAINVTAKLILEGIPVAYISSEMGFDRIIGRMAHTVSGVRRQREMTEKDFALFNQAQAKLTAAPLYCKDDITNWAEAQEWARDKVAVAGVKVIVLDHIQRFTVPGESNPYRGYDQIARQCKALAQETNTTVIALSQLHRSVEKEKRDPTMADAHGSSNIESEADVFAALILDGEPTSEKEQAMKLKILKNRDGEPGLIDFVFRKNITRFQESAPDFSQIP